MPALVIGGEWLMQGCRGFGEYRQVIDKYLRAGGVGAGAGDALVETRPRFKLAPVAA